MAEYIGSGKVYQDNQYLADVKFEIVIEHDGALAQLSGCIYADENLERLFGGLLPELILQLTAYQQQFRFLPLRADSVIHSYAYDVIPRGQPERMV
jgi:hypothetical protein